MCYPRSPVLWPLVPPGGRYPRNNTRVWITKPLPTYHFALNWLLCLQHGAKVWTTPGTGVPKYLLQKPQVTSGDTRGDPEVPGTHPGRGTTRQHKVLLARAGARGGVGTGPGSPGYPCRLPPSNEGLTAEHCSPDSPPRRCSPGFI